MQIFSSRAFHFDLDPDETWIETVYDEFTTTDGVTRARRSRNVDLETGEVFGTTTVTAFRIID